MFFWNNKAKKYKWEPVTSDVETMLKLINECVATGAPICRLIIRYNNTMYKIGVNSDCKNTRRFDHGNFFDSAFYINDNEYGSFDEFRRATDIDGTPLEELKGIVYIVADEDMDDPRNYTMLKDK